MQRRSESKDVCPGVWDLSVSEHLRPGDTFNAGAIRGAHEELGITGLSLRPIGSLIKTKLEISAQGIKDYEFQMSFLAVSDADVKLQNIEVAEIDLYELDKLKQEMLEFPEKFTPWFKDRAFDMGLFRSSFVANAIQEYL